MVREDLISSAVTFLRDPSVASASLEKRREFLESKNLTQEEIQIAFARAGSDFSFGASPSSGGSYPAQGRPPPGYQYGFNSWTQQAMPPPRRDWRDWFIMATVTAGAGYGLFSLARRYVMPLISPPTPPQLEQDKAAIDAEFSRAFALIDQLAADTAAIKAAETERNEKLDAALQEVDSVITELTNANKRREEDSRRLADDVRGLRDLIPKALDDWKAEEDARLKEVSTELKSLKMLVGNRVGSSPAASNSAGAGSSSSVKPATTNGIGYAATARSISPSSSRVGQVTIPKPWENQEVEAAAGSSTPTSGGTPPRRDTSSGPFAGLEGRSASRSIPAWQLAASNKNKAASSSEGQSATTGNGASSTGSEESTPQS